MGEEKFLIAVRKGMLASVRESPPIGKESENILLSFHMQTVKEKQRRLI
jgi:hypothetical protein